MTPAHPDDIIVVRTNQVKTTFFSALPALVDALEDEVGFLWFLDGDHLHFETISLSHQPRKRLLADLALKFCEVVRHHHACHFLLYLTVDPHLQALHVNTFT